MSKTQITLASLDGEAVNESKIQISNAGSNGNFLQKQSGNTGGLTWASASADADDYFASLSSKDLGSGLHLKVSDTGASVDSQPDTLVLEENGGSGITILSGTGSSGEIAFGDSGDNNIGRIVYAHTDNLMYFTVNAAERMRIKSNGDFNINKTVNDRGTKGTVIYGVSGGVGHTADGDNALLLKRLSSTGSLVDFSYGGTQTGTISIAASSTAYNTSSDYRLKENEVAISDGIERLKQLKPYKFNFKADADKTVDGFFAHEVSSIVPEAISGEKDAMIPEVLYTADDELPEGKNIGDVKKATKINPQQIDQAKLVPLLTSALQEAITKIETLETEMTALKARVTTLEE